ncbi:RdgB/HAM1 family non-canonical purine NTP pyrophosphatase [bacterium]|nr:RdgB/HAM1 family non-canonical purine NTP pyrophosphatase [bacterium]
MLKITLATSNPHKVKEINLIAKDYDIEFILPNGEFDPIENGKTFLENAKIKALEASKTSKTQLSLADDSGLCVEALDGRPGIYSARYDTTPQKRIDKLLGELKGIENRNAKFVCAMVLADSNQNILYEVEGICKGEIMQIQKGSNGFGYDPIFYVEGLNKGMAELSEYEKSKVSHRSRALHQVLDFIQKKYL